jgi:hypothetical protein
MTQPVARVRKTLKKNPPYEIRSGAKFTTAEVAKMFDLSRPTLCLWLNQGRIVLTHRTQAGAPVWGTSDIDALTTYLAKEYQPNKHFQKRKPKAA